MPDAATTRLLVEAFARHRPRELSVRQTVSVIRRLIAHAYVLDSGCIVWPRARNNDHYGKLNIWDGVQVQRYCHRLAHLLASDPRPIPHYREIGHRCDCPPCFHPAHLERVRRSANRRKSAERTNRKLAARRAVAELRQAA